MIAKGEISGKMAKDILPKMFASGESASAIVEREGLRQISDTGALEKIVDRSDRRRIRSRWSSTAAARRRCSGSWWVR